MRTQDGHAASVAVLYVAVNGTIQHTMARLSMNAFVDVHSLGHERRLESRRTDVVRSDDEQ